jgi:hypothetical protein
VGDDTKRAALVGNLINAIRPEVFIHLGDAWDLESLCSHNSALAFENKRYKQDLAAGAEFFEVMFDPIRKCRQRWRPEKTVMLLGNHEIRTRTYVAEHPHFQDFISTQNFELGNWFTRVIDYDGAVPGRFFSDGICFTHFAANAMGRACAGTHLPHNLLNLLGCSVIVGHNHLFQYASRVRGDGRRITAISAGCLISPEAAPFSYAGTQQTQWNSGCLILRNVHDGQFDMEWVSLERLRREYP